MDIKKEIKVIEYIEYDGIKFYRDKKGYWLSKKASTDKTPKRLHTYVWEKYNGTVPNGYHVHHIDHDTDNNEIDNLVLMEKYKHLQYHARLQDKEKLRLNLEENARPKAIEWHKSAEGKEWHRQQYEQTKESFRSTIHIKCVVCGKETTVGNNGGNKFCSNACKTKYRRMQGKDNVKTNCLCCGKEYETNKYNPARFCSKECRNKVRYENKEN